MTDIPSEPRKPLTISSLFFSSLMTGAMICGVIGGLAVLFFADGLFDIGPDPAIPAAEVEQQMAQVDQRIQQLEKATQARETNAAVPAEDLQKLQENIEQNTEQTQALEEKIDTLSSSKHEESKAAQIALGLTQIRAAYENDLPIASGIETLKSAVSSESLQKTLDDLAATTSQNFPSKKELLTDIDHMKTALTPAPVDPSTLTWDQRAKQELNKFVKVQPQQVTAQQSLLTQTENYIRNNDFDAALSTIQKMPASAQQKIFYGKIEMRIRAEMMIHKIISDVTQKIVPGGKGSLY